MEKRICPICEGFLEKIEVPNKYGIIIRIDRCPSGCELWFDQFELYQINFKESERVVADLSSKVSEEKDKILCPVCRIPMVKMKTSYFSEEILLDYCNGCSGIWVDRDKLLMYKSLQEKKTKRVFKEFERDVNYLSAGLINEENKGETLLDLLLKLF